MKKTIVALTLGLMSMSAMAVNNDPYATDERDVIVKSGTGLCWETNRWTPADANEDCHPELMPPKVVTKTIKTKYDLKGDFLFKFDSAKLTEEGRNALNDIVNDLEGVELTGIDVVGHASSEGSDKYNQKLSERRANTVKDYIVSKGVSADLITASGKGEKEPIADNKTKEGRKLNRRVEITINGSRTETVQQ